MIKKEKDVLVDMALLSRLILIFLGYISNLVIPDHDAEVFTYPKPTNDYSVLDKLIFHLLGGFLRWDGQYFMHIVLYGYTYENTVAFFPLYPVTVRIFSVIIQYFLSNLVSLEATALVVFIVINTFIFVLSVKTLYEITKLLFNSRIAFNAAIAFCFNPASVFFTAPYTECLFSFLTLKGIHECLVLFKILHLQQSLKIHFTNCIALLPISLSTLVRSNGILNIGFFLYTCICLYKCYIQTKPKNHLCITSLKYFVVLISVCIISAIPFILYQIYCYNLFCTNFNNSLPKNVINYGAKYNFVLPGKFSEYNQSWCYESLPSAYSYVQNHYWNVGFLKYYELKQIPNFILAFPILFVLFVHCLKHLLLNASMNPLSLFSFQKLTFVEKKDQQSNFLHPSLNVFVIHGFLLVIFCIFFVHIQVSTRMLCSASPLIYWCVAKYFSDNETLKITRQSLWNKLSKFQKLLVAYFIGYFVIGTVMFCNFLPWT